MHEALLGVEIPLPIRTPTVLPIANSSAGILFNGTSAAAAGDNYAILWEMHNGTGVLSPNSYVDIAAYTYLEYSRRGNRTGASAMLETLNIMFDGQGLVDEPYQNGTPSERGVYQTFKLALYILVLTKQGIPVYPGPLERLLTMQDTDGGFRTGYDNIGTYSGTLANAETTSIVILTLSQLTPQQPPNGFLPWDQWWSTAFSLYLIVAVVAGVAITVGFIHWDQRKRRAKASLSP